MEHLLGPNSNRITDGAPGQKRGPHHLAVIIKNEFLTHRSVPGSGTRELLCRNDSTERVFQSELYSKKKSKLKWHVTEQGQY